jgi:hypothetical protein
MHIDDFSEADQHVICRPETTKTLYAPCPAQKQEIAPIESTKARRPKRIIKATRSMSGQSTGLSEKELKVATQRNTAKNMVFHCAIDREVIRISGPRPPSPTSKIRTIADRDEEEKRAGRGQRAKRRSRNSDAHSDVEEELPLIERVKRARGPGEDEDYATPVRYKEVKHRHGKTVRWNRELTIIRYDGRSEARGEPREEAMPARSALKLAAQVSEDMIYC